MGTDLVSMLDASSQYERYQTCLTEAKHISKTLDSMHEKKAMLEKELRKMSVNINLLRRSKIYPEERKALESSRVEKINEAKDLGSEIKLMALQKKRRIIESKAIWRNLENDEAFLHLITTKTVDRFLL